MRAHGAQVAASSPAQHAPHGPACFRVKLVHAFFSISENLQHRRNVSHEWHAAEVTQNKQRDTFSSLVPAEKWILTLILHTCRARAIWNCMNARQRSSMRPVLAANSVPFSTCRS
jgi:hypothetical protein